MNIRVWSLVVLSLVFLVSFVSHADTAQDIINATGVKGGLIVHVGCGDGRLTAALHLNDSYVIHGLDSSADNVAKAREHIRSLGLYGDVSVASWRGKWLPYADNLVNLLVAEDASDVSMQEVMRVLAPLSVAYIKKAGKWGKTVKPWPEGMDEWTHWLHSPDGNPVARDSLVGPPRRLQWVAKPLWSRHHNTVASTSIMVSARGRVFYINDEGPPGVDGRISDKWYLTARDGFNGALLWKLPIPEWGWKQWRDEWHSRNNQPVQLPKRLVAIGDTVYVTLGFNAPVTALDAATGKVLKTYKGTDNTDEILFVDGLLVLAMNKEVRKPDRNNLEPIDKSLAVLDADSGEILWKKDGFIGLHAKVDSIRPWGRLELVVGEGRIFLTDRNAIVALDIKTGDNLWRVERPEVGEYMANFNSMMSELTALAYNDGVVLFAQPEFGISQHSVPGTMYAYSAKDGSPLWKRRYGGWVHNTQPNIFVINGLAWIHEHQDTEMKGKVPKDTSVLDYAVLGVDLHTGEEKRRFSTKETFDVGHHHRCYRNKATERFLLTSRRGVEFMDIESGGNDLNHWVRGACQLGVMPCNGLLYTTPHPCDCHIDTKLNGYFALAPKSSAAGLVSGGASLEKGPAYEPARSVGSDRSNDWPTFRGDSRRSGSTSASVSANLKPAWEVDLGGELSPPVVAHGKVFVASIEQHLVLALDENSGKTIWSFTAGGRVDTPPTVYNGLVLFGAADGWVYCLRESDGQLAWRRRVAPSDRLIGAFGQVESPWPVHGSVLVKDDVAYVAAGRSSYLDGGIFLCGLNPVTGEVVEQRTFYSPDPETGKMPPGDAFKLPGGLADILVSDGASVWMRQNKVFGEKFAKQGPVFATGGLRDETWFNRTTWSVGGVDRAQLLVFDEEFAYGIAAYATKGRNQYFKVGEQGYRLFAKPLAAKQGQQGHATQNRGKSKAGSPDLWSKLVPIRATAMAVSDKALFIAGAPDVLEAKDSLAPFEGRKGALLRAVSTADGEQLSECKLEALPVWDGMALASGKLYMSLKNGSIVCMDGAAE